MSLPSVNEEIRSDWSRRLTIEVGRPVEVAFGRARRNVIVVRSTAAGLNVRLNAHFVDAPDDVRAALAAWLRNGKRARAACKRLDAWIEELGRRLGPPTERRVSIRARGDAHDLFEIAAEVLRAEFPTELTSDLAERVTWGRRGTRPARRSLQLGSYDPERDLVRIHPVLDQPAVPRFFVRYVLFHELLHAASRDADDHAARTNGRAPHHSPAFRRRERAYGDFDRAVEWQSTNLSRLFSSARTGKPMRAARRRFARDAVSRAKQAARAAQGWLFPDHLTED